MVKRQSCKEMSDWGCLKKDDMRGNALVLARMGGKERRERRIEKKENRKKRSYLKAD